MGSSTPYSSITVVAFGFNVNSFVARPSLYGKGVHGEQMLTELTINNKFIAGTTNITLHCKVFFHWSNVARYYANLG